MDERELSQKSLFSCRGCVFCEYVKKKTSESSNEVHGSWICRKIKSRKMRGIDPDSFRCKAIIAGVKSHCENCGKVLCGDAGGVEYCRNEKCRMRNIKVCSLEHHELIIKYREGDNLSGATGKYDREETPLIVFNMLLQYFTDKEICNALSIHHSTYYEWLKSKPELSESVRAAKKIRAQKLVPKLRKRAAGYFFTEKTEEPLYDKSGHKIIDPETGKQKIAVVKRIRKYQAPDVAALKFFLTNQDPEEWKDKSTTELETGKETGLIILSGKMSVEEWQKSEIEKEA